MKPAKSKPVKAIHCRGNRRELDGVDDVLWPRLLIAPAAAPVHHDCAGLGIEHTSPAGPLLRRPHG